MAEIYSELIAAQLENLASDPAGSTGRFYWNSGSLFPKYYNGAWKTFADTTSAQVFTGKDYDGGTASNTSRTTIPKDTLANLTSLTRKEATLVYATDHKKPYFDTGLVLKPVGSGGSGSGITYIDNPSAADDLTGWASSGAGVTVTRTTTAANLPREPLTDSAIVITCVSGTTDYAYFRFQLGDADKAKQLFIGWAQKSLSGYAAGDLVLEMWTNSASNYGGTYTQLLVANPDLAEGDYVMKTTFSSSTADYYELRVRIAAGTGALAVCDVTVSPQVPVSVPAITDLRRYDSDFAVTGLGTGTVTNAFAGYSLSGNMMTLIFGFHKDGSAGSGGAAVEVNLPPGYTIASTYPDLGTPVDQLGYCTYYKDASGNTSTFYAFSGAGNSTVGFFSIGTPGAQLAGGAIAANDYLFGTLTFPVNEASSNIFVAESTPDFAFNTDTADGTDLTAFGYGEGGQQFGAFTVSQSKRVRFRTAGKPRDIYLFQFTINGGDTWLTPETGGNNISAYMNQNSTEYGVTLTAINSTDVDVGFSQYRALAAAAYGAAGQSWAGIAGNSQYLWRILRCSNPIGIGHDLATPTKTGLVSTDIQDFAGVKKFTGGLADFANETSGVSLILTDADKRVQTINAPSTVAVTLASTGVKADELWTFYNSTVNPVTFFASNAVQITGPVQGAGSVGPGFDPTLFGAGKVVFKAIIDDPVAPTDWKIVAIEHGENYETISFVGSGAQGAQTFGIIVAPNAVYQGVILLSENGANYAYSSFIVTAGQAGSPPAIAPVSSSNVGGSSLGAVSFSGGIQVASVSTAFGGDFISLSLKRLCGR